MTANKLDINELKSRFTTKYRGKSQFRDGWGKIFEVDSYVITYKEPKRKTLRVYTSSELACWRIIDLALFFLRYSNGELLDFPERHKVLERKAHALVYGEVDYKPKNFESEEFYCGIKSRR